MPWCHMLHAPKTLHVLYHTATMDTTLKTCSLYEEKSKKPAVTGNQTQASWLEPPVLYNWATTNTSPHSPLYIVHRWLLHTAICTAIVFAKHLAFFSHLWLHWSPDVEALTALLHLCEYSNTEHTPSLFNPGLHYTQIVDHIKQHRQYQCFIFIKNIYLVFYQLS